MRTGRFGRLLAGTVLTLIVAAPTLSVSAPATLNGHRIYRHRTDRRRAVPLPRYEPAARNTHARQTTERYRAIGRNAPYAPPPASQARTVVRRDATPLPTSPPAHRANDAVPPAPAPAHAAAATVKVDVPAKPDNGALAAAAGLDKPLAGNDAAIGAALRTIVTAKTFGRGIERAAERKAIMNFYAAHNYAPLWIKNGGLTARAKIVIGRLRHAETEGLMPSDYPVPPFATLSSAERLAKGDIGLTYSLLTFVRHLATGRIAPRRVFAQVEYGSHTPDPDRILTTVFAARDVSAAIESFDPPDAGFRALKHELAVLRSQSDNGSANRIPDGPLIHPGQKDARIPAIRARLGVRSRKPGDTTYDRRLVNIIRGMQQSAGLGVDGVIGGKTLAKINGPSRAKVIDTVEANMERWRWLPRDLGDTYVMVNVPDFTLKVLHDGKTVWRTKIVAGKPQTPTPLLSASMNEVIVNPSWYVPQSIIHNELLPRYETDPNIFDRLGLEVKKGPDGHINVVQPPGAANALGRIKFNFNNKFLVYLHDTPERQLFRYSMRAFSHGCMRVQDPTKFGELILSLSMKGKPMPNARQIRSMYGHEEHDFRLMRRPKVHVTYQTAFVDQNGKLQIRDDIYGFDARIHAILHSPERKVADVAPPPDPTRDLETAQANQEILRRVERREAHDPFSFFEQLFR
ncbi:MAG: L,D-transpeptidase family protein [Pseudolabrys sp.]